MLAKKIFQLNQNTKKKCDLLSVGGLVSQPNSPRVQSRWAGFLVGRVTNWLVLKFVKKFNLTWPKPMVGWVCPQVWPTLTALFFYKQTMVHTYSKSW